MDDKKQQQLDELEIKVDKILASTKKTERYIKITFWGTVILVVLPAVLLAFALPALLNTYTASFDIGTLDSLLQM